MEIKAKLEKPYTENDELNFIVEYSHNQGYAIEETETSLQALGYTEEEIAEKEAQRIAMLYLTGADVERGIYQAKGMDFEDIIAMVEQLIQTIIDEETGEIVKQGKQRKIKVFKYMPKNNYHKTQGHRQPYTKIVIKSVK